MECLKQGGKCGNKELEFTEMASTYKMLISEWNKKPSYQQSGIKNHPIYPNFIHLSPWKTKLGRDGGAQGAVCSAGS